MKYGIKKIKKRNGDIIYIPMAKSKGILAEWHRIINLYGKYDLTTSYLDTDFGLSMQDCETHIEGYRKMLEDKFAETTETVEMVIVDGLNAA